MSKKYRDAFVLEHARNSIAFQIRVLREERGWTQKKLGEEAGKPPNVISRLEDPNYGKASMSTLFEIASAYNCALLVKFVPYTRLLREYDDVSPAALSAKEITHERKKLEAWAITKDKEESSSAFEAITSDRATWITLSNDQPIQAKLDFDTEVRAENADLNPITESTEVEVTFATHKREIYEHGYR